MRMGSRSMATTAFAPTPVPIPTATISICTGKARVRAFRAFSPFSGRLDTKALSTILYTACSIMDRIMGMPMFSSNFGTGIVPILLAVSGCFSDVFNAFCLLMIR